jgi:hypothetical protein
MKNQSSHFTDAHPDFYDFCEAALFRAYEVEICSPEGNMLPGLIEAEFDFYKIGKRDVESLCDFLESLDLDPAIPRHTLTLYLASLFIGEVIDAFGAHQSGKSGGTA